VVVAANSPLPYCSCACFIVQYICAWASNSSSAADKRRCCGLLGSSESGQVRLGRATGSDAATTLSTKLSSAAVTIFFRFLVAPDGFFAGCFASALSSSPSLPAAAAVARDCCCATGASCVDPRVTLAADAVVASAVLVVAAAVAMASPAISTARTYSKCTQARLSPEGTHAPVTDTLCRSRTFLTEASLPCLMLAWTVALPMLTTSEQSPPIVTARPASRSPQRTPYRFCASTSSAAGLAITHATHTEPSPLAPAHQWPPGGSCGRRGCPARHSRPVH
jgi:hypothetical protein